ncbi:cytochrome P450 [Sphaerisporangium sp. NPDC005289]|uniref:cytochrome P450 family protein n=1 Tax=Sphaerisporangium sp. NPDC005289 TaxID=3155247 RepID=UPI0033A89188
MDGNALTAAVPPAPLTLAEPPGAEPPAPLVPYAPGFQADPYPVLARLRESDAVASIPHPFLPDVPAWLVLRHAAVRALVTEGKVVKPVEEGEPPSLNSAPPDHTRLRALVQQGFSTGRIEGMRARVQRVADDLVDGFAARGEADLIAELTGPLPVAVTAEMLGVPEDEHGEVRRRTAGFLYGESPEGRDRSFAESWEYLTELVAAKRARPGADMTSALIAARDGQDRLSEDELLRMLLTLLVNGFATTIWFLASAVHALLAAPSQLDLLRARPDLLPGAVEEALRYEPVVSGVTWVAERDLIVDGVPIGQGDLLITSFQSANRDPRVFADPDRFDITRSPNPHLGFSHGIHRCLGAPLARLETRIVLATVLRRLPGLRLAGEPRWQPNKVVRGLEALPVTFIPQP